MLKIDDKNQQAKNLQSSIVKAKAEQEAIAKQNQQRANEIAAYNQSHIDYNNKMAELDLQIKQCDYDIFNEGNSEGAIQASHKKTELMRQELDLTNKQILIEQQQAAKH